MKTRLLSMLMAFCFLICLPLFLRAQGGPGGDPDAKGIPFDGGIILTLAAGAGYAIKKARDQRKKTKDVLLK